MWLVFSKKTDAHINMLPNGKGEMVGDLEIGREGSEKGKGRWSEKF